MQTYFLLFSWRKPLIDYSCLGCTFNLEAFSSYLWLTIWHMRARVTFISLSLSLPPPPPLFLPRPWYHQLSGMGSRSLHQGHICLWWFGYHGHAQSLALQFLSQRCVWSKINYTDRHSESCNHPSRFDSPLSQWFASVQWWNTLICIIHYFKNMQKIIKKLILSYKLCYFSIHLDLTHFYVFC